MKNTTFVIVSCCALFALFVGGAWAGDHTGDEKPQAVAFTGKVTHIDLEGGFWGIVAEDGTKYDPTRLDGAYQHEGLSVRVEAVVQKDAASTHMWGKVIKVSKITRADATASK